MVPLHSAIEGVCSCAKGADCPSAGKHPRIPDWTEHATTDAETIAAWAEQWPNANVGVATGRAFWVLDEDRPGAVAELEAEHGPLPRTTTARTGSGGTHYLFSLPENFSVKNSASKIAPGVDVRGEGGQIVVAPSVSAKGRYTWVIPPWEVSPADPTAWLLELVTARPATPAGRAPAPATRTPPSPEDLGAAAIALERLTAIEGQGGDQVTFAACSLVINDFDIRPDEGGWELLSAWNKRRCVPSWSDYELAEKMRHAEKYAKNPRGCRRVVDQRPTIQLTAGKLAEHATELEQHLIAAREPLFDRGGDLVRPVVDEVDAAHGRKTRVTRLVPVSATYLRDLSSRRVHFTRFSGKSSEIVTADPPLSLAETILAREGERQFPRIVGVIGNQTIRPDGSLLSAPGFDGGTGLLLQAPPELPPIPAAPTQGDALKALEQLEALVAEIPFVDAASRSVALSALITSVVRPHFSVAPLHAMTASTPGTGKSYVFDLAAAIAIGQRCPVVTASRNEEELEKRLGAALLQALPLINLDNLSIPLAGDALAQFIERPVVSVRVLGESKLVRIESRSTLLATGNNLQIVDDQARRVVVGQLDAHLERPELRQFKGDPFRRVIANRGRYIAAALTVVLAYLHAGQPKRAPRLASFEGWSDSVRSALIWLGRADPCATMERARETDPVIGLLRSALAAWAGYIGTGRANARTAAVLLEEGQFDQREHAADLHESITAAAMNRGRPDVRTLGKWLARHKGRIVSGLRLHGEADAHGHAARWWVERVGSAVTAVPAVDPNSEGESE